MLGDLEAKHLGLEDPMVVAGRVMVAASFYAQVCVGTMLWRVKESCVHTFYSTC